MAFSNHKGRDLERAVADIQEDIEVIRREFDRLLGVLMDKDVLTHDDEFKILFDEEEEGMI